MILGMSIVTFTAVHVIITLVAIVSGFVVVIGILGANRLPGWTALFLFATILTSVSGFLFPIHGFTPALALGALSCVLLLLSLIGLYGNHLAGAWRWVYVVTAVTALYFNVFVLIVQLFEKISALNALAPQFGPPFAEPVNTHFTIAQGVALVVFPAARDPGGDPLPPYAISILTARSP